MFLRFPKAGLARKLLLGFGALIGLMLLTTVISAVALREVSFRVHEMDTTTLPGALHADRVALNATRIQQALVQAAAAFSKDDFRRADAALEDIGRSLALLREHPLLRQREQGQDDIRAIEEDLERFVARGKHMADVYMSQGGIDAAATQLAAFDEAAERLIERVEALQQRLLRGAVADMHEISSTLQTVLNASFVLTALIIGISLAIARGVQRSVMAAIGGEPAEAVAAAREIAGGNLAQAIASRGADSLMAQMEAMRVEIRAMITNLAGESSRLLAYADALSGASRQLASGTEQGNVAATRMAATIEEMASSIARVADDAEATTQSISDTNRLAGESGEVIIELTAAMTAISRQVVDSAAKVELLGEQSESIRSIVHVISEIAEQTNLLALNAAIEAARAGESGRGFAVVADEVRKLAERTASSTRDISHKIGAISESVAEIVVAMHRNVAEVSASASLAQNASTAIGSILEGTGQIVRLTVDIGSATSENASASRGVAENIVSIATLVEQNSGAATELAQTADKLNESAARIGRQLGSFRT